eukprot:364097-Chlamydomonas_euryale.AAC.8
MVCALSARPCEALGSTLEALKLLSGRCSRGMAAEPLRLCRLANAAEGPRRNHHRTPNINNQTHTSYPTLYNPLVPYRPVPVHPVQHPVRVRAVASAATRQMSTPHTSPHPTLAFPQGGDAALNAQILRDVCGGQRGAVADALCLNAGVALAAARVAADAAEGVAMAQEAQRSGAAARTLDAWIKASQAAAAAGL